LENKFREESIPVATDKSFIEFIEDQINDAGVITHRKMFGEYALYCDGKVVAFVCDNQLFVKPTEGGRAYIANPVEMSPYPGAKLYFLIEDAIEDREWIRGLIKITAQDLPMSIKKTTGGKKKRKIK
jgi:TfoX/Sxy family transcriptional regulator of competence genes